MIEATFGSREAQAKGLPLHFNSPLQILSATLAEDVYPLLQTAEAAAAAGYWVALMLSYEAAPAFDPVLKTKAAGALPLAWAAVFTDPTKNSLQFVASDYEVGAWQPLVTRAAFSIAIDRIREFIASGDTYQVNYTFPLVASFRGDPRSWYRDLCTAQGAKYCAYFDLGRYKILSLSPELFFERQGQAIQTRPMKGTIKRGRWPGEDNVMAKALAHSAKDRAENVMIVDLLRNDLGRVSTTGSVEVTRLFEIERYETLWQMTSTIEATLRNDIGLTQLMAGLFPCGSITGAPKIRTMEIIRELEAFPRGIYTGTLGFLRPGGDATLNVAIRTVVIDSERGEATFGVGGGITYDSTAALEYEECLVKSAFLSSAPINFQLLESLLLESGAFFLLKRHIQRMRASAEYFGFDFSELAVTSRLEKIAADYPSGRWKVRLLSSREGELCSEAIEIPSFRDEPLRVVLAAQPVNANDKFLFHKTTNRAIYEKALATAPACDDVILWNEDGEITESTVANVVVSLAGKLLTPPQTSGLLAGTFREELLATGEIKERVISLKDLRQASALYLVNSVHKWREAVLVD